MEAPLHVAPCAMHDEPVVVMQHVCGAVQPEVGVHVKAEASVVDESVGAAESVGEPLSVTGVVPESAPGGLFDAVLPQATARRETAARENGSFMEGLMGVLVVRLRMEVTGVRVSTAYGPRSAKSYPFTIASKRVTAFSRVASDGPKLKRT